MNAPPIPHTAINKPPNPAPTICEMFIAMLIITIAFSSVSRSTTVGTIAFRTGNPTAMVAPTPAASTSASTVVIAPATTITPAANVTATATSWLPSTSERRLMRSASTPAGIVRKITGMPSAKNTAPAHPDPRPSPPTSTASITSQTKAKRCIACTSAKLKVLIQRYVKGRDLNAENVSRVGSDGRPPGRPDGVGAPWTCSTCSLIRASPGRAPAHHRATNPTRSPLDPYTGALLHPHGGVFTG